MAIFFFPFCLSPHLQKMFFAFDRRGAGGRTGEQKRPIFFPGADVSLILLTTIRACGAVGSGPRPAPAPTPSTLGRKQDFLRLRRRALKMARLLPSRALGKGHPSLICGARSLLGRKTRGGGGAGAGAGRAGGEAGNVPPGPRAAHTGGGRMSGARGVRGPGGSRLGGRARVPGARGPLHPRVRACARAQRGPHTPAAAASAAPAPCSASAAPGGPQNPGWSDARTGAPAGRAGEAPGARAARGGPAPGPRTRPAGRGGQPGRIPDRASEEMRATRAQPVLQVPGA